MTLTTVLLAEDEPLARAGITMMLAAADDIELVGEAHDGRQAVAAAQRLRPDVILMDLQMPVMTGLEALTEIRRLVPGAAVVILTAFQSDEYLLGALRLGATGYLMKDCTLEELYTAIRAARAGDSMLSPSVTRRLLDVLGPTLRGGGASAAGGEEEAVRAVESLTDRERDVLRLLTQGLANAEMAAVLGVGEGTVKTHVASLMGKLSVSNRTQAAILGYQAGLSG